MQIALKAKKNPRFLARRLRLVKGEGKAMPEKKFTPLKNPDTIN
jgi:hypothetical protein